MRPRRWIHDRVITVPVQNARRPRLTLARFVLRIADTDRRDRQRLLGTAGRKDQLDAFPIALVLVVPVVVVPVEPVLQCDLVGLIVLHDHPGIDSGLTIGGVAMEVLLVQTSRVEGDPGEVEVKPLTEPEQIIGGRTPLHHRITAAHLAERDLTVAQERVDGHWFERLAVGRARARLRLHHHDRGVALGELLLGIRGERIGSARRPSEQPALHTATRPRI